MLVGRGFWKQSTNLWSASEYIIWVDKKFFTNSEENIRAKYLEGGPIKGGPGQVPRLPPLKSTTAHYHSEKPPERITLRNNGSDSFKLSLMGKFFIDIKRQKEHKCF